jgi:hypothetical protein
LQSSSCELSSRTVYAKTGSDLPPNPRRPAPLFIAWRSYGTGRDSQETFFVSRVTKAGNY